MNRWSSDQTDDLNRSSEASGDKRTFNKLNVWLIAWVTITQVSRSSRISYRIIATKLL